MATIVTEGDYGDYYFRRVLIAWHHKFIFYRVSGHMIAKVAFFFCHHRIRWRGGC